MGISWWKTVWIPKSLWFSGMDFGWLWNHVGLHAMTGIFDGEKWNVINLKGKFPDSKKTRVTWDQTYVLPFCDPQWSNVWCWFCVSTPAQNWSSLHNFLFVTSTRCFRLHTTLSESFHLSACSKAHADARHSRETLLRVAVCWSVVIIPKLFDGKIIQAGFP